MADFYAQGVVRPAELPKEFITKKDKETLAEFDFSCEINHGKLYFYAEELSFSYLDNEGEEHSEDKIYEIFQNIIKRSKGKIPYLMLEMSHTCSKMDPGGYGGQGIFITADKIEHISTYAWLANKEEEFNQNQKAGKQAKRGKHGKNNKKH